MADADFVITGTVLTVDNARPTAEGLAVADGRIVAVGSRSEVGAFIGPDTQTVDVVLSADPRTVPEQIADLDVRATYLAGRQVYAQ